MISIPIPIIVQLVEKALGTNTDAIPKVVQREGRERRPSELIIQA